MFLLRPTTNQYYVTDKGARAQPALPRLARTRGPGCYATAQAATAAQLLPCMLNGKLGSQRTCTPCACG